MAESNRPKHGDPIIELAKGVLGTEKYQASFQFQRYLDELSTIFDLVTSGQDNQEAHTNSSEINQLRSQNRLLASLVNDSAALAGSLEGIIGKLQSDSRILKHKVDDLEQLINANQR